MRHLDKPTHDVNLLVGHDTSDDAGIYKLTDEIALIQTVDYFTPVVDDPYLFGQIAAANALSDVYAMGGEVKTALNIVGFPIKKLGGEVLAEILKGAQSKVTEAGGITVGGHSIDDQEPKFGLAVTGIVHPEKFYRNVGAQAGDALVLTKPLGVGIITTAIKREKATENQKESVVEAMATLNKTAAEKLQGKDAHAVTDITGFGLLGHLSEMANGSHVSAEVYYHKVPQLEGTLELAQEGVVPGGSKSNHRWLKDEVSYNESLDEAKQLILCDSITSGGLLVSLPSEQAEQYVKEMKEAGHSHTAIIGQVTERSAKTIDVKE